MSKPVIENLAVVANTFEIVDGTDGTKKVTWSAANISTGTTRTLTLPDQDGTIALTAAAVLASDVGAGTAVSTFTTNSGETIIGNTAGTTNGVTISSSGTDNQAIHLTTSTGGITLAIADEKSLIMGNTAGDATFTIEASATADNERVKMINTNGTNAKAVEILASAGGVAIECADEKSAYIGNDAKDLYIEVAPSATAGSEDIRIVNTNGTDEAAVQITSTSGGVDIDAAAGKNVAIDGGQVLISSKDNASDAIYLHSNVGTSETIRIHNDQGTARSDTASSIQLTSDVGGITLYSAGYDGPDAIKILGGASSAIQLRSGTSSEGTDIEGVRNFLVSFQTTTNSTTTYTFSLDTSDRIAFFKASLTGFNATTSGQSFYIQVEGVAVNQSGTPSISGANTTTTRGYTSTAATVSVTVTAGAPDTINLVMTGIDSETINWYGCIEFITNDTSLSRTS